MLCAQNLSKLAYKEEKRKVNEFIGNPHSKAERIP